MFKENDIHIHLPAGSIPKDGPSAGITVTLAIASALSERAGAPRRRDDGRGDAARQGARDRRREGEGAWPRTAPGCASCILPKSNEKDLRELPEEVRAHMAFTFASTMDEVFRLALLPPAPSKLADSSGKGARRGTPSERVVPIERTR